MIGEYMVRTYTVKMLKNVLMGVNARGRPKLRWIEGVEEVFSRFNLKV